jgi:hypothetical protein
LLRSTGSARRGARPVIRSHTTQKNVDTSVHATQTTFEIHVQATQTTFEIQVQATQTTFEIQTEKRQIHLSHGCHEAQVE